MENTVTVIFRMMKKRAETDLEIPLSISANDLVLALNAVYRLQIDTTDVQKCYLKAENPIAFLRGNQTLAEFGIRNGTIISYTE